MIEKKIRSMTKAALLAIFEETKEKIDEINQKHTEIIEIRESLDEGGLLNQIREVNSDATEKADEILEYHQSIFEGNEESSAIKNEIEKQIEIIEGLIEKCKTEQKEIEEKKREMCGYIGEGERGEEVKNDGYIERIQKTLKKYEEKYGALYERIETELDSGATTVSLSKNFNDKVKEYKKSRRMWEGLLLLAFVVFGVTLYLLTILSLSNEYFIKHILRTLPFFWIFYLADDFSRKPACRKQKTGRCLYA